MISKECFIQGQNQNYDSSNHYHLLDQAWRS